MIDKYWYTGTIHTNWTPDTSLDGLMCILTGFTAVFVISPGWIHAEDGTLCDDNGPI
jgi:hypothetical protein